MATRELEVVGEAGRAAVLFDPARRKLLQALVERPDSAVGLARRLGDTRQRLNYHLRALEETGLVELAEERQRRGVKERVMRPVARRFVVDSAALGGLAPDALVAGDRFSATWLVAMAARAIGELAGLMERARRTGKRLATAGLSVEVRVAEPAAFEAFVADLTAAVGDVVKKHHSNAPGGRTFRVTAGLYPKPGQTSSTRMEERA
jgi:DNA-binding transcriptional ArsR family regulator